MSNNRGPRGSASNPITMGGNSVINQNYSKMPNSLNNQSHLSGKNEIENNKNSDGVLIAQLQAENKQLKLELSQTNRTLDQSLRHIKELEKNIEILKNHNKEQSQQNNVPNTNRVDRIPYGDQFEDQFYSGPNLFNDFIGMEHDNFVVPDDFYVDPVREVEDHIIEQLCPNPDYMTYEQLLALEEKVGSVSKGLSKSKIDKLPMVSFSKSAYKMDGQCVVCQFEFKQKERVRKLPCGHLFHTECVDEWLLKDKTCPCCKKEVNL